MTKDDYKVRVIDATIRGNQLYLMQKGYWRSIWERRPNRQFNLCLFEWRIPEQWIRTNIITKDITLKAALEIIDNNFQHTASELENVQTRYSKAS